MGDAYCDMNPESDVQPSIKLQIAGEGDELQFTDSFRVGRSSDNDVVLDDAKVSDHHLEVVFEDGNWWIQDLGSTNGLIVTGKPVDRYPVTAVVRVGLGYDGPSIILTVSGSTRETEVAGFRESEFVDRYFGNRPPDAIGAHTAMMRTVIKKEHRKRTKKYKHALIILIIFAVGAAGVVYLQRQQIARQRVAAAELFYAIKSMELEVARLQLTAEEAASFRQQRAQLETRYEEFLEQLGVYSDRTPRDEQLIYQVIHRFGEAEVNVPRNFLNEVKRYIDRWKTSGRFARSIARAEESNSLPQMAQAMLATNLPPEFIYLALQESDFDPDAVGPRTRFGYAKGMWQLMPGTARGLGLKIGPLVGQPLPDPQDERHDVEKSTRAAARHLRFIYTTDAQASGLLVMAAYNWGQNNVIPLIRSMPANPRDRNYWRLITTYRDSIPDETYGYVLSIVAAAVIGEDPELFGFEFERLLLDPDAIVEAGLGVTRPQRDADLGG